MDKVIQMWQKTHQRLIYIWIKGVQMCLDKDSDIPVQYVDKLIQVY